MTAPVRDRYIGGSAVTSSAASAVTATATFAETPAVGSDHILVAEVRRRGNTANDPVAITTPSGWNVLGTTTGTNGTITVGLTILWKQGDGVTNSISVDGTTGASGTGLTTTIMLTSFTTPRSTAPFLDGYVGIGQNGVTTQSVSLAASGAVDGVPIIATAISGTAGGTGFVFSGGTLLKSTGSADSFNSAYGAAVNPAAGSTKTSAWTTGTIAVTAAFWVMGLGAAMSGSSTITETVTVDMSGITTGTGGTITHSASPAGGVTIVGNKVTIAKQTTARIVTITSTDSGGAPSKTIVVNVQPPPATTGLERRRKSGGIL